MKKGSPWPEGVALPQFSPLAETLTADVAVVGAGITGVTCAYRLAQAGLSVVIVEGGRLGGIATKHTTAFLTQSLDTAVADLIAMFGKETARAILGSHGAAIDAVENIIHAEKIECDFQRCSNYLYASSEEENRTLQKEQAAAREIGLAMNFRQDGRLGFANTGYLELPNQAKLHPFKYLAAAVEATHKRGVKIFEDTEVLEIEKGQPLKLKTPRGEITAKHVVVATYAPFDKKLFFKKALYTSYVLEANLPRNAVPEGIYEDMQDPYHYFRVDAGQEHDRVIFGGEDHRSDIPVNKEKSFRALDDHFRDTFTGISTEIVRHWRGPILESVDGLAWIGRHKEPNIYYATGFSGNGMTYSMIAAQLLGDLIQGKPNAWESVYDPRRWPTLRQLAYKGRDYTQVMIGGAVRNTFRRGS